MVERPGARVGADAVAAEVAALERRAMAWPPTAAEREPGAWRDDVAVGLEPFEALALPADVPPPVPSAPVAPEGDAARRAPRAGGLLREAVEIGGMALLLFALIRFASQNYLIERESMLPTLQPGDMVLVNKLGYRLGGGPERGDVVVFHAWPQAGEKDFVKRVVAIPGDALAIRDGHVEVNGVPVDEPYVAGAATTPDTGPLTLGPEDYYVMGDNRANSVDSRAYGPLPRNRIVGKAWITYWPPTAMGVIGGRGREDALEGGGGQDPAARDALDGLAEDEVP